MIDQNFDELSDTFQRNIYGTLKGQLRLERLWNDLQEFIPSKPNNILDIGGGFSPLGQRLAALGHEVSVTDISQKLLDRGAAMAEEAGLKMQWNLLALQDAPQYLPPQGWVMNHAVLEWLADPQEALGKLYDLLTPGGILSLAVYNRHAMTLRHALNAQLQKAQNPQDFRFPDTLIPQSPQFPQTVESWLKQLGFITLKTSGIRCFFDYMPKNLREQKPLSELIAIEEAFAQQEPYRSMARYIHWVVQKPK